MAAVSFMALWPGFGSAAPSLRVAAIADDSDGRAMLQAAERMIAAYHDGHEEAHHLLRVVYFHASDREPLPGYAERLDRVLKDVSDFYRDGVRRFGIENNGLPLERRDGRLVLHVVRGRKPAAEYSKESGDEIIAEIRDAVAGVFDLEREHVLVLYGLGERQSDGRYLFNSPYYGSGSQSAGIAHAVDCELLDPALLTETKKTMIRNQDDNPRLEQSIGGFNGWYIGGIAHELGHALGLPHDAGHPAEHNFGTALMGVGNRAYREEMWGPGKPAFLSRASALQLISHPFFTGSDRGRWQQLGVRVAEVEFSARRGSLEIRGKIGGEIPPYAIIVYAWPRQTDEHYAQAFSAVLMNGELSMSLDGLRPADYRLRFSILYVNGSSATREYQFGFDRAGTADATALNTAWMIDRAESAIAMRMPIARSLLTDEALAKATTPEARRKLRLLRDILAAEPPSSLAQVKTDRAFLSDVAWIEAAVGWGQPARNHYWFDENIQDGVFLTLGGEFHAKGLFAHAPSRYVFAVDGKWRRFAATVGLRDGADPKLGSAVFTVRGDGRELFRSTRLRVGDQQKLGIDITDVKTLELVTDSGWEHNYFSWAIWVDPELQR